MSAPLLIIPGRRWDRILRACIRAPLRPNDLCRIVRPKRAGWFRQDKSKTHKACQLLRQHGLLMYDAYGEGYLTTEKGKQALGISELTVADDIPVPKVQVFGLRQAPGPGDIIPVQVADGETFSQAVDRVLSGYAVNEASQTGGQEDEVLPATEKGLEAYAAAKLGCASLRCTMPLACGKAGRCKLENMA